jgi:hypothetical protein
MPNWTTNTVTFTGPTDQLVAVKARLAGEGDDDARIFDFDRITPMPPVLHRVISPLRIGEHGRPMLHPVGSDGTVVDAQTVEATEEEAAACATPNGGYTSWYDWAVANWGTKWNACHAELCEDTAEQLTYRFDSAWDAPRALIDPFVEVVEEVGPDLEIEWEAVHEDSDGTPEMIFVKGA